MTELIKTPQEQKGIKVQTAAVFFMLMYLMVAPVHIFLWTRINETFYIALAPILLAFYLYFLRFRGGIELKIIIVFWLWMIISRFLNGIDVVFSDYDTFINYGMYIIFFSVCFLLEDSKRRKLLSWCFAAIGTYYTILAIIGIVCAVFRITVYNPLIDWYFASFTADKFRRLNMLGQNPNVVSSWFLIGFYSLFFLFFNVKGKMRLCRILIVPALIANYLALSLTYSRNAMLGFSVCTAIFAMMLALKYLPARKIWQKSAMIIIIAVVFIPLNYKSFDASTAFLGKISGIVPVEESVEISDETLAQENVSSAQSTAIFEDPRDLSKSVSTMSSRIPIWKSIFYTIRKDPLRLIRGCGYLNAMEIPNEILPKEYANMHNSYVQAILVTGLPGFLLTIAFTIIMLIHMIKLFFSMAEGADFAVKSLILAVAALLMYGLLEALLFYVTDFRGQYFYLVAGAVVAWSKELSPNKKS